MINKCNVLYKEELRCRLASSRSHIKKGSKVQELKKDLQVRKLQFNFPFKLILITLIIMSKYTILFSLGLGGLTGLIYRDELYFPTNMRIKVAVLEYHLLTRQKLNTDLLDIIDPNSAKDLAQKSEEIQRKHDELVEK